MAGRVFGTIPFLGPAVAGWITLVVGVMAFYFLSVSRQYRTRDVQDPSRLQSTSSPGPKPRNEPFPTPWVAPPSPMKARGDLPVYDMENYPDERWAPPVDLSVH